MIWNFIIYSIPWWVWLTIGLVVAAALFLLAVRAFGWERVKPWVLPVLTVIGAGALLQRAQQKGWQDKIKADMKAADKLIERTRKARAEAERDVAKDAEDGDLRGNPHGRWRD